MSNRVCSSCGKTFESFGLSSGPAICNECLDICAVIVEMNYESKVKRMKLN